MPTVKRTCTARPNKDCITVFKTVNIVLLNDNNIWSSTFGPSSRIQDLCGFIYEKTDELKYRVQDLGAFPS